MSSGLQSGGYRVRGSRHSALYSGVATRTDILSPTKFTELAKLPDFRPVMTPKYSGNLREYPETCPVFFLSWTLGRHALGEYIHRLINLC